MDIDLIKRSFVQLSSKFTSEDNYKICHTEIRDLIRNLMNYIVTKDSAPELKDSLDAFEQCQKIHADKKEKVVMIFCHYCSGVAHGVFDIYLDEKDETDKDRVLDLLDLLNKMFTILVDRSFEENKDKINHYINKFDKLLYYNLDATNIIADIRSNISL
jgi:2-phosphoglycerate kinase